VMSLRYPSFWTAYDPEIPYAVKGFGDSGTACILHIQKDAAVWNAVGAANIQALRDALFKMGAGDSFVPGFCKTLRTGEVEGMGDNPVKIVEYAGHDGQIAVHELLFVFFYERRLIVLRMGCRANTQEVADSRFQGLLPTFVEILKSASFKDIHDLHMSPLVIAAWTVFAIACATAIAVYLRRRPRVLPNVQKRHRTTQR
jgi:hypothetical protein